MTKTLCVKNEDLTEEMEGKDLIKLAKTTGQWLERDDIEEDPTWRQVIPYIILFSENDDGMPTIYTYIRKGGDESRLHNLWSIGLGGHLEEEDNRRGTPIMDGACRELREEVRVPDNYSIDIVPEPVGMIKLDGSMVNQVHVGLIIPAEIYKTGTIELLQEIESNEDHIPGKMMTIREIKSARSSGEMVFEDWSCEVIDSLIDPEEPKNVGSPN